MILTHQVFMENLAVVKRRDDVKIDLDQVEVTKRAA
jgi:hypothetical protein